MYICHGLVIIAVLFESFSLLIAASDTEPGAGVCPLWHIKWKGVCRCGDELYGVVTCQGTEGINIQLGNCMTWSNETRTAMVNRCPFTYHFSSITCPREGQIGTLSVPLNISGPELDHLMCKKFNRQGTRCRECRNGYGPAAFSDGFSCSDCSKHRYLWILHLFLQLTMVTLMYLLVILFQVKGTSSPLNVIITYSQLSVQIMVSVRLHVKLVCSLGPTLATVALTIVGVSNLDFFRFVIPPLCISSSLKSINVLLFDYITAFYPVVLTLLVYKAIELHDRNCWVINCLAIPVKRLFGLVHRRWNPKGTILNTCVTFILLAYSKLLCTSINLIFGIQSYDIKGDVVAESTLLFYDPSIRLFHSEHVPYALFALSVMVIFVLLPPLLLLLYPTRLFRKCLSLCGFQRWDILHLIADVFQGWFKDGTEGTLDYRALSALYMLMRIVCGAGFLFLVVYRHHYILGSYFLGLSHIFLGTFFLTAMPYKKKWMNVVDGLIMLTIGMVLLISIFDNKLVFLVGSVIIAVENTVICLCKMCFKAKRVPTDRS